MIVAAEVVAIFVGLAILNGPLSTPGAAAAWVALVVGAHFSALAELWRQGLFHWLAAALLACGAAGLLLAFTGAPRGIVDVVGGVVPGAVLMGFGLWGIVRSTSSYAVPSRT